MDLRLSQAGRSSTYGVHALLSAVNGRCDDSHPNGRGQDRPNHGQYASGATQVARPGRLHRRRTRQCRFRSRCGFTLTPRWCSRRSAIRRSRSSDPAESLWAGTGAVVLPLRLIWTTHRRRVPPHPAAADSAAVFVVQPLVPAGLDRFLCGRAEGHRAADQPTLKGGGAGRQPDLVLCPFLREGSRKRCGRPADDRHPRRHP